MSDSVKKRGEVIPEDEIEDIATKRHHITEAVNKEFNGSSDNEAHSFYVGSYGRHTAIESSDVDLLVELPEDEYERFDDMKGNGQSRLLQAVKDAIKEHYSTSVVRADGQVVVISFSNGRKFEVLPAFKDPDDEDAYTYPDTNMGGRWLSTYPKVEREAMREKNGARESNGLLDDTCRHIRGVRDDMVKKGELDGHDVPGIVIDSFVYSAIGNWKWLAEGGAGETEGKYEKTLLKKLDDKLHSGSYNLKAPGSGQTVKADRTVLESLRKVLDRIAN